MIYSRFNNISPNFTIGFPFEMYYQFEIKGKCDELTLLHGAHFINIIYKIQLKDNEKINQFLSKKDKEAAAQQKSDSNKKSTK